MRPVRYLVAAALLAVVALAVAGKGGVGTAVAAAPGVGVMTVHSAALEGNLLGDSADQPVAVYLPPGYAKSARRYPVLYLLHGIGDTFTAWTEQWQVPAMLDRLIESGAIEPLIVVMPNGRNSLLGSFYLDSPVIGGWGTFVVDDLVAWVDAHYRTVDSPTGRALAGHSMGGFGAISLAMDHPGRFSVVYAMSPCCLDFTEDIAWGNPAWRKAAAFSERAELAASLEAGDFYPVAIIGLASALSPNRTRPLLVDLPFRVERGELLPEEPVYSRWLDRFPANRVGDARDALRGLELLALDYGIDDQFAHIPAATARFSRELARHRVPHRLEVYEGDHRAELPERLERVVLPAISASLRRAGSRR